MVYVRIKKRVIAQEGERLMLCQVADVLADASLGLHRMPISLPRGLGIWHVDALQLILQIQEKAPGEVINVLGDGTGWLHRQERAKRDAIERKAKRRAPAKMVRWLIPLCAVLLVLFIATTATAGGQALRDGNAPLFVALPYALGISLGVLLYQVLVGRHRVSPLLWKIRQFRGVACPQSQRSQSRV